MALLGAEWLGVSRHQSCPKELARGIVRGVAQVTQGTTGVVGAWDGSFGVVWVVGGVVDMQQGAGKQREMGGESGESRGRVAVESR
jgi:hypothetical protein